MAAVCDNLIGAWELWANLQDKESFIEVVYDGIKGGRRKMVAALRQFIEVDNRKALSSCWTIVW